MMIKWTCFTVSKSGTKESGGVAAKSKKVEDHRCHRVCLLLVVRIVRLEKVNLKSVAISVSLQKAICGFFQQEGIRKRV